MNARFHRSYRNKRIGVVRKYLGIYLFYIRVVQKFISLDISAAFNDFELFDIAFPIDSRTPETKLILLGRYIIGVHVYIKRFIGTHAFKHFFRFAYTVERLVPRFVGKDYAAERLISGIFADIPFEPFVKIFFLVFG